MHVLRKQALFSIGSILNGFAGAVLGPSGAQASNDQSESEADGEAREVYFLTSRIVHSFQSLSCCFSRF